ncbi:MAG: NPCBM/NEW2 domain-containing protein [Firmicutes bacterium]|nr:NPCBM/NEW2 domain-containing protein [Bacillota bacterium]
MQNKTGSKDARHRKSRILIMMLMLAAIFVPVTACTGQEYRDRYNELVDEHNDLQGLAISLLEQYENLQQTMGSLQHEKDMLAVQLDEFRERNAELQEEAALVSDYLYMREQYETIQLEKAELTASIETYRATIEELIQMQAEEDNDNEFANMASEIIFEPVEGAINILDMPLISFLPDVYNSWMPEGEMRIWNENRQDNAGNVYEARGILAGHTRISGIDTSANHGNRHSVTYLLNSEFSRFTGIIALCWENRNSRANYRIIFFGDDEIIYESPMVTGGVLPFLFDVDVTGIYELRVERRSPDRGAAVVGIVNAFFVPK